MSWGSVPCLVGLLAVAGCDGCAGRTNEAGEQLTRERHDVIDDEALRDVIPPRWRKGQSWTVEQFGWEVGIPPQVGPNHSRIDFEVATVDGDTAVVTVRGHDVGRESDRATLTIALQPFRLIEIVIHAKGPSLRERVERDPGHLVVKTVAFHENLLVAFPQAPSVVRTEPDLRCEWKLVPGGAELSWPDGMVDRARHVVTWRKADPWWARHEALDVDGRTARREPDLIGRRVPAAFDGWLSRARLIAIDGKPIDPMPWSD